MRKNLLIIFILIFLVAVSVSEEIIAKNTTQKLDEFATSLAFSIQTNESNLNCDNVLDEFDKLNTFWKNEKTKICFFTNYDKLKFMDESMIKLQDAIKKNDTSLVGENLSSIKSFKELVQYVLGFNFQNLF